MLRFLLPLILLICCSVCAQKPATLRSCDVLQILDEILEVHATYNSLTPEIIQRSFKNYLDLIDPTKTYLLQKEVSQWLTPSSQDLEKVIEQVETGNFSPFFQLHNQMLKAIERRERLERLLISEELESVETQFLKENSWANSEEELISRLREMRFLQKQAAEKLEYLDTKERILQRIEKHRLAREEQFQSSDLKERESLVLSNVLKAISSSFDSQTAYFTPQEAAQFMIQVQQRLCGIGAQLRDDLDGFTIVRIIEGGPASRSPLKEKDRVVAIDNEPVVGMEINDAVELIRGEEGSEVLLTVFRQEKGEEILCDVPIIRGEVVIKEARIESRVCPFGEGVIASIALHAFYQDPVHSSCADLYKEISKLKREHRLKGLILDLRQNSGGVLPQAVGVTSLFITKGIVVSIKDHKGHVEHLRDVEGKVAYDGPLVILVSKASASAAEIVAQTLQDYGRAIVVGDEHTFGKGTFQTFTLEGSLGGRASERGEYKVTRGRYYTVSGKSPQLVGVIPDIVIPGIFSNTEIGEKYAKYPLPEDKIEPNFHDDLADIPSVQRDQVSWLYRFNLQQKVKTFTRYIPQLAKNSNKRIENSPLYKSFLDDLEKNEISQERSSIYALCDPQHEEAINIIKDLILFLN